VFVVLNDIGCLWGEEGSRDENVLLILYFAGECKRTHFQVPGQRLLRLLAGKVVWTNALFLQESAGRSTGQFITLSPLLNLFFIPLFFQALGVDAVVGMLIMLGAAIGLGIVILFLEHLIFRRALPFWRAQPKGTLWRSPNIMFFSQVGQQEFTLFVHERMNE
jgi:hypothetical protein